VDQVRFDIPPCTGAQRARLRLELGIGDELAQALVRRDHAEPDAAHAFLHAGEGAGEDHDPWAFEGLDRALGVIWGHVRLGSRITVHGDYDVDGVCSTAVLVRTLRACGAMVDWHLPDRGGDGYGLSIATVERLRARGTALLVSADCGVGAVAEVAHARGLGMDVVITDHHSPPPDGSLPQAPIVHPRLCGYPCPDLCATAVAYKLARALWAERPATARALPSATGALAHAETGDAFNPEDDLDLVAMATIADVVPLLGENRALVRRGLRALARTAKPGLRALMEVAGVQAAKLDERAVAFGLAPRINAAGRLYRADGALELLLTADPGRARALANELDHANRERRETERAIVIDAEAQLAAMEPADAYVLAGEGWHAGVIGIVASRLAERHHRPFVLISLSGERGKGSGRSIATFDLLGGLHACSSHLSRYGGHRAAAGIELDRAQVEDFARALKAHAAGVLSGEDLVRCERIDAVVSGERLGLELAEELARMAPFGNANPPLAVMVEDAVFQDARPMGEGKHVRFKVCSGGVHAQAVAFGSGGRLPVAEGVPVQASFRLEVNEWRGVSEPRLVLRNVATTAVPGETVSAQRGGDQGELSQGRAMVLF
jgi:single-stranded-DNA-specific exonuclease